VRSTFGVKKAEKRKGKMRRKTPQVNQFSLFGAECTENNTSLLFNLIFGVNQIK